MLEGTKKLFPNDYETFKYGMLQAAENDQLPVVLQLDNPEPYTIQDFQDMFMDFEYDTGLSITGEFFICSKCKKIHVVVDIDYQDEDDEEGTLLQ